MWSDLETKAVATEKTTAQQCAYVQRATVKLKKEIFKSIADGWGRKLKCEEFPELAHYIEFAFSEGDRVLRGGGGLEAERWLLDTTLFKATNNATVMRHAKELIKRVRPDFKISTSCLYTYTMNYRKGSRQVERHHHGKGVNPNISLHKSPNTSQNIYPVNAHWSTSHVNYLLDPVSENVSYGLLTMDLLNPHQVLSCKCCLISFLNFLTWIRLGRELLQSTSATGTL